MCFIVHTSLEFMCEWGYVKKAKKKSQKMLINLLAQDKAWHGKEKLTVAEKRMRERERKQKITVIILI